MKKKLIFALCCILCLIPIAILILQAVKTQIPPVYMGDEKVKYAYYEWNVTDHDDNVIRTKKSDEDLQKAFEKAKLIVVDSLEPLQNLEFAAEPLATKVNLYDLNGGALVNSMTYAEFQNASISLESGHNYQMVLLLNFKLMRNVSTMAAYSFEVQIP